MEEIISKLSKIEESSGAIMDQAGVTKKALADSYAQKTSAFDATLTSDTQAKVSELEAQMNKDIAVKLESQQKLYDKTMQDLQATYDRDHDSLAQKLFEDMIKE